MNYSQEIEQIGKAFNAAEDIEGMCECFCGLLTLAKKMQEEIDKLEKELEDNKPHPDFKNYKGWRL